MDERASMQEEETVVAELKFLKGGGKMGEIIRAFNWATTPLGAPETWPQSLRISLGILLNSKFPMFLFWGPQHICFYNDAYRPSLGNHGKHPGAIGKPGIVVWPEIWAHIKPLIDQVLAGGEGTWSENQLLPIYRNNRLEDVYWTFSYSPVHDIDGFPAGVFVTCTETTEKIAILKRLQFSEQRFKTMIKNAPVAIAVFRGWDLIAEMANDAYLPLVGKTKEEFIGKPLFESLPETREILEPLAHNVMQTGIPFYGNEFEITLNRYGKNEVCYFNSIYEAVYEPDGSISGMMVIANEVTQQVVARKYAEESERRLLSVLAETPVATAILTGPKMRVEMFNDAMLNIWRKGKSIIGQPLMEYIPELVGQPFPKILEKVYTTGETYIATEELAYFNINETLTPGYFDYSYTAMRNTGGDIYGILVLANDVTDTVNDRRKVEESESNLRNIILQAPVAMCILKSKEHIVEIANDRMFELWGKNPENMLGKPLIIGLPEIANQGFEELLNNVYTTGETFTAYGVPANLPRKNSIETVYVNFVYEAFKERDGTISGVMVVANDVTEQVLSRKKIEIAEERARLAIESAELGVYEINLQTDEVINNPRLNSIFGMEKDMQRPAYAATLHLDDRKIREQAHAESYNTGNLQYEARVIWKDHSVHWIRVKGKVLFDEQGKPAKLLGVVQDITDQKLFAEKLTKQVAEKTKDYQEAMEQLVKKNQELEQFAYVASHDLKEPLRMISSYSYLLLRHMPDNEEAAEYSRFMTEGVSRMQALINDLLDYSRIGQKPTPLVETDINLLLSEVTDTLQLNIEENGAEIHYSHLPKVAGVPTLLSQLFQNLIDNAIKFRKNDTTPLITITAEPANGFWLFAVNDNGIGIAKEYQERIFVIFQRLHTRDKYPGTGIGLSVCKRIVELHSGKIWLESDKEKGTTFFFTLPAA
ncbi:MAG: PAS domain-containing sensor histidine kinase [Bacteroidia bacterium]